MNLPTIAAVVSATGGLFAAFAAWRSARSAQITQQAADDAEHRASLRQVSVTASDVVLEAQRVASRGNEVKRAYRSLFTFGGSYGGSRQALYKNAVDEKLKEAGELSHHAELFVGGAQSLKNAPLYELDRVQTSLSAALSKARALREDLEREYSNVEGQCAVYREKIIEGQTQ